MQKTAQELEATLTAKYAEQFGSKGADFGLSAAAACKKPEILSARDYHLNLEFLTARLVRDTQVDSKLNRVALAEAISSLTAMIERINATIQFELDLPHEAIPEGIPEAATPIVVERDSFLCDKLPTLAPGILSPLDGSATVHGPFDPMPPSAAHLADMALLSVKGVNDAQA